jgi:hypothetical protein
MTIVVTTTTLNTETLGNIRSRVQARGYGNDINSPIDTILNGVHRRVCATRHWPWLEFNALVSLTSGSNTVDLEDITEDTPSLTVNYVDAVNASLPDVEGGGIVLVPTPKAQLKDELSYIPDGLPTGWCLINRTITISPIPDQDIDLDIDYIVAPKGDYLATDSTPVLVPPAFDDVLVWGTIKELAFRERDADGFSEAQSEYAARLNEMIAEYGLRQRQSASQVGRWAGWNDDEPWQNY